MLSKFSAIIVVIMLGWAYQSIQPPPPKLCGSPNGPPITSPRIQLRDGRHLAYRETGAIKEMANYRIIIVHALNECKELGIFASQVVYKTENSMVNSFTLADNSTSLL